MDKRLKELSNIQIDMQQKQESYEQIQQRIQRRNWKIPSIVLCFCAILIFLVGTAPELRQAHNKAQISKIVVANGEANVVSAWQLNVQQIVDKQKLRDFSDIYKTLKVEETVQLSHAASYTIKVIFTNNTSKSYIVYLNDDRKSSVFYEMNTDTYFQTVNATYEEVFTVLDRPHKSNLVLFWLIPLFTIIYLQRAINKKMRVEGESNRKLPRHSTHWQSVSTLLAVVLLFSLFMFNHHLHYGLVVLISLLNLFICLILESRYGKNKWRYIAFVMDTLYILFFCFLYFYVVN